MSIYRYTKLEQTLPPIPVLQIQLMQPGAARKAGLVCSAILDTSSDCTLVPIALLQRVNAQIVDCAVHIPVGGVVAVAVPYVVGMTFDQYHLPALKVFGCAESDIGDTLLIGRDVMNRYQIEFNGPRLEFEIF